MRATPRGQLRLIWTGIRWIAWPPETPLWAQLVYKIGQTVVLIGLSLNSLLIMSAGIALVVATVLVLPKIP